MRESVVIDTHFCKCKHIYPLEGLSAQSCQNQAPHWHISQNNLNFEQKLIWPLFVLCENQEK